MTAEPQPAGLTLEEYLTFEELGEVRHDLLTNAVDNQLFGQLGAEPCRVFPHNRKLVTADGNSYYPDLLVTCGAAADRRHETDASMIVEVLSPTNKRDEPDDKLEHYLALPSLQVYLTLDPDAGTGSLDERQDLGWRGRMVGRRHAVAAEVAGIDLGVAFDDVDAVAST